MAPTPCDKARVRFRTTSFFACRIGLLLSLLMTYGGSAAEITFRLVRADLASEKVSTATTYIDLAKARAMKAAEKAVDAAAAAANRDAGPALKDDDKPRAEFDRYTNYMRGIIIDKKHPFQRSYKGSYLGRSDEITLELADGEHRIDPGNHRFTIRNGKVSSDDPSLVANGQSLDVILYPITIIAIDGSAVRDLPAEVLRLPVSPRVHWGRESVLPREEAVAGNATFKRLTLYMMANAEGPGYRVSPSERHFHVTPEGAVLVDEDGQATNDRGVYTEGQFTIVLPKIAVPVTMRGAMNVKISGPAGNFAAKNDPQQQPKSPPVYYAFAAAAGANIRFGNRGENGPYLFRGDLARFPRRALVFDATASASEEPRLLSVAAERGSVEAGKSLTVRIDALDALDANTLTPFQPAAYIGRQTLLGDDGSLSARPATDTADAWQAIDVRSTEEAGVYQLSLPANLKSSVYWLRIVVAKRGHCSPTAPLAADFVQGVIAAGTPPVVSVFCPTGRHAYFRGSELPFSCVIKSRKAIPAAKLIIQLTTAGTAIPLIEREMAALPTGRHAFHYTLSKDAVATLREGNYKLTASYGTQHSNAWTVRIVSPPVSDAVTTFDDTMFATDLEAGTDYLNVPPSIVEANKKRQTIFTNVGAFAHRSSVVFVHWSMKSHSYYQGRDNSSEVAQVAGLLAAELALPAEETYYYQNHFELVNEAFTSHGMEQINSTPCFSILSLDHSVPDILRAKARQHQLITQIAGKFDSVRGLTPNEFNTSPLGNSEIVDPARHVKLMAYKENFIKKHGFARPLYSDIRRYAKARAAGETIAKTDVNTQWEAYVRDTCQLTADYFDILKRAIDPLAPDMLLCNRGPSWTGTTADFNYPGIANANQPLQTAILSGKDANRDFIWEQYYRIKFHQISGGEIWDTDTFSGKGNNSYNFGLCLMGGGLGYGYMAWDKPEVARVDTELDCAETDDAMRIRAFADRYGRLFRQLDWQSDIAVYYSFHQSAFDDPGGKYDSIYAAHAAMLALTLGGYDAAYLTDEMLDRDEQQRYKAIIVPTLYELKAAHLHKLEAFANKGGTVLVGSKATVLPAGSTRIDADFDCFHVAHYNWSVQAPVDAASVFVLDAVRGYGKTLTNALSGVVQRHVRPRDQQAFLQTAKCGDARYTVICNARYPSFMGTTRLTKSDTRSYITGEANENTVVPQDVTVDFPADWHVYDILTQTPVSGAQAKDNRRAAIAELRHSPFRVLVSVPDAITGLEILAPTDAQIGSSIQVQIRALAGGKRSDARLPVAITLTDATGTTASQLYAVTDELLKLPASVGTQAGRWRLSAHELATGQKAEISLDVTASDRLPLAAGLTEAPTVMTSRPHLLQTFLAARKQDQNTVLILLDAEQRKQRHAVAEALQKALAELGVKTNILSSNAPGVHAKGERLYPYGRNYTEMKPSQYIDHHVILIGGHGEQVLIEEIQEAQLLDRSITSNYPGPRRALLTLVRSPFAMNRDVLCLLGSDNDALLSAVKTLKTLPTDGGTAPAPVSDAQKLTVRDAKGSTATQRDIADAYGNEVIAIRVDRSGKRIGFALKGYAMNVAVLNDKGKAVFEDNIGHALASDIRVLDDGATLVSNPQYAYRRTANGNISWQLNSKVVLDPSGRYVVAAKKRTFQVYDMALKPLWGFDEWDACASTKEILLGRKAKILGTDNDGNTLVYHLSGKAPGPAGVEMDAVLRADALTGKVVRKASFDRDALLAQLDLRDSMKIDPVKPCANGYLVGFRQTTRTPQTEWVMLDHNLSLHKVQSFAEPLYFGDATLRKFSDVVWEDRQLFVFGNQLCLSNPAWTALETVEMPLLIRGLAVDHTRRLMAISDYSGTVRLVNERLATVWESKLPSAATLAFLPDGRLVAGTVRGKAVMFDQKGQLQWETDLRRYAPPETVEARWREVESAPKPAAANVKAWWQRIEDNVPLSDDLLKLASPVSAKAGANARIAGEPFATYLVVWQQSGGGDGHSTLVVHEDGVPPGGDEASLIERMRHRLANGAPGQQHGILKLGHQPRDVIFTITSDGDACDAKVSVRKLQFPSENHIRWDALYHGDVAAAAASTPPAQLNAYTNVSGNHGDSAIRLEPAALVNGRMLQHEAECNGGKWWGGGTTAKNYDKMIVPSWIEIELPRKRVLTHIVLAEDPALGRGTAISVDAYIAARETRRNLTAREKREVKRGFWHNVVKFRGNDGPYNVFQFDRPVGTDRLRVYILDGSTSLGEIELYGALNKKVAAQ